MGEDRVVDRRADDAARQEFLTHIQHLREDMNRGFTGVHQRMDTQNGRVSALEKRESAHHERIGALEDRNDENARYHDESPHQSKKRTAVTLSLGAGGGALLIKVFELLAKALGSQ